MKTKNLKPAAFLILFLAITIFSVRQTFAADPNSQGITVIPSIQTIDLATDQPEYEITYLNGTDSAIDLTLSAQDFTQLEDGYKISFLEGKEAANYKYSLSSWISFGNKNLHLDPGEKKSTTVFIDNKRITRGGHYASILAKVEQPADKKKISINTIISSLLFIRSNTGFEIENANISSFQPLRDFIEFPDSFTLRFQNSGNVQVIPYGVVNIYGPAGNKVATGIVNEGSLNTIPESIRKYNIETKRNSKIMLPGFYRADISLHYGKTNKKIDHSMRFFSEGSLNFKLILIVLIIGMGALYFLKKRNKKEK